MNGRPADPSPQLREIVEEYTPDGIAGRLLLALASGGLSLFTFWMFAAWAFNGPGGFWLIFSVVPGAVSVVAVILALLVLWPVYLSLIGQVDSASEYSTDQADAQPDDELPVATLKREYAQGNVSEEEFERRLETLLDADASMGDLREKRPDSERTTDLTAKEKLEDLDLT